MIFSKSTDWSLKVSDRLPDEAIADLTADGT